MDSERAAFVSVEIERTVLAAALLDPGARALIVAAGIVVESFGLERHAVVWGAILELGKNGGVIDPPAVANHLKLHNKLQAAGGWSALVGLTDSLPTLAHAERHALELCDLHTSRKLLGACVTVAKKARAGGLTAQQFRDEALSEIQAAGSGTGRAAATRMDAIVTAWWKAYDAKQANQQRLARFGIASLDVAIGDGLGLEDDTMIVLAARPGMGKTALAVEAVLATAQSLLAAKSDEIVLVFSLEMPKAELATRMLSAIAKIDSNDIKRKTLSQDACNDLTKASGILHGLPIVIDDTGGISWREIRARVLAQHAKNPVRLVVIDNLSIIGADPSADRGETDEKHLRKITAGVKALAKEIHVPIILIVHLNRDCEKRPNKRPQQSDLRGSGTIEQDADVIMFIYRDEVYYSNKNPGIAEILLPKVRSGYNPKVKLRFKRELTSFEDLPEHERLLHAAPANDNSEQQLDDAEPF